MNTPSEIHTKQATEALSLVMPIESQTEGAIAVDLTSRAYAEVVRRIPETNLKMIQLKLKDVSVEHLVALEMAMANQSQLLQETSFIHNPMFAFTALQALSQGNISPQQFGTLMSLWGNMETIFPVSGHSDPDAIPRFIPFFNAVGEKNKEACVILLACLQPPRSRPNLIMKSPETLLMNIYEKAAHLPPSEQGFWLIKDSTVDITHYPSDPLSLFKFGTVTQILKHYELHYLTFPAKNTSDIIPSFGLQQIFLDVAFIHPVRLNPVIGDSTTDDIRNGSEQRYRDIALPFPGFDLPKLADGFPAPRVRDFMFHDFYHAIRASRVIPHETAIYVAMGDRLATLQQHYDTAVLKFSACHRENIARLCQFGKAIQGLPANKQHDAIEIIRSKFNQELAVIAILKRLRKATGQLKFRIWDMERTFSGDPSDKYEELASLEFQRIINNLLSEIEIVGQKPNANGVAQSNAKIGFNRPSARITTHAILDVIKPEASVLKEVQTNIRKLQCGFFYKVVTKPCLHGFHQGIMDTHPAV